MREPGIAVGAVVSALVVLAPRWRAPPTGTATAQRVAMATQPPRAACPQQPAAAPSGRTDGRFNMPARLSSYGPSDIGHFTAIGKEAAAAGRSHDAEVAFLVACRVADQFKGSDSVESGKARDQLAAHYDDLLREGNPTVVASRGEMLRRAELLRPGRAAPSPAPAPVLTAQAPTMQTPPIAKPQLAEALPAKPQARPVELAKAVPSRAAQKAGATAATAAVHPSFDCAKARSVSEKMICSDAQLAQLDRELAQLHTRARISARNTWAFNQRHEEEWRRREATCHDRDCLLRWYGQRRHQLMNEIESG